MNDRVKNVLAYIGIFILFLILGIVTYYKYFAKSELLQDINQNTTLQEFNNKKQIRNINNLDPIVTSNFSLSDLQIKFHEQNKVISITGNINNLTNNERKYKILSQLYNKDMLLIFSKEISIDTKIQPKDTIPFFINYYYEELNNNINEVVNYKLEVIE